MSVDSNSGNNLSNSAMQQSARRNIEIRSNQNEERQAILKEVTSVASCTADIEHYV